MSERLRHGLSKRERQIMEAVYTRKKAAAAEVRATLQVLVTKGLLTRRREGRRYLYVPTISSQRARLSATRHLLSTYFEDSVAAALTALLRVDRKKLTDADYQILVELIREAEREG